MTSTDLEAFEIEQLEFAPPCEYGDHDKVGSTEPAVWIIYLREGCCKPARIALNCDPCFQTWRHCDLLFCARCGDISPPEAELIRAERM
jgi:hypothetical protein